MSVHVLTDNPTAAWDELRQAQNVMRFKVKTPKEPVPSNKARVVCISDTHSLTSHMKRSVPNGDILIHAGDFTRCGSQAEVREFNSWLGTMPHQHKIVIAGNHELSFDETFSLSSDTHATAADFLPSPRCSHAGNEGTTGKFTMDKVHTIPTLGLKRDELQDAVRVDNIRKELTNCIYLEDSSVVIYGLNIYGTPWQPEYCGWAFNLPRGNKLLEKWNQIPEGTDILITHSPPVGYGDHCCTGVRAGCVELLNVVQQRIKPKYHIYGHIHEGYGVRSDGKTVFINASICDSNYVPSNKAIVFDIPIPKGVTKD